MKSYQVTAFVAFLSPWAIDFQISKTVLLLTFLSPPSIQIMGLSL